MTSEAIHRVLVATDLGEPADEALRAAHGLANGEDSLLGVCHVVPLEIFTHPLFPERSREEAFALPEWKERTTGIVADRVERVTGRKTGTFDLFVVTGSPAASIVRVAEDWKANTIVVGSHGSTGLTRILVGSVALRVARHAHCLVRVARARSGSGRIVVGTDFSDPALPAVTAAAEEARRTGGRVTIVHCADLPTAPTGVFEGTMGDWSGHMADYRRAYEKSAEERLEGVLAGAGIDGETRVFVGPAAAGILRAAEETEADLIVVGTRGRTGLARMLLGSVAEAVVGAARTSVLVVRLGPA